MDWRIIMVSLALLVATKLTHSQNINYCIYNAANCSCETNMGYISLKPLASDSPQVAKDATSGATYYWNPCSDFTLGTVKAGVIEETASGVYKDIGVHTNEYAYASSGYAYFNLQSYDWMIYTTIRCACSPGKTFQLDSKSTYDYAFSFISDFCCPGYVPPPNSSSSSISPGSVLLIVFFAVLILYLVGGTIYLVGVKKVQGRERVPNVNFWTAIPGLVKDGFVYTVTRVRRQEYSNI